ncbi:Nn.00g070480.m01.CDS01 [Neocucurbitaria sp. VM-36]
MWKISINNMEVDFCSISAAKTIHGYRQYFQKGEMYRRITMQGMENVFSTTSHDFHASQRRLLSASLSESNLKQFERVVTEKANHAVERIGEEMKKIGAANVMKWWLFMATDIIGELSFGDSFRMLEQGRKNQYAKDLEKVAFMTGLRISFHF